MWKVASKLRALTTSFAAWLSLVVVHSIALMAVGQEKPAAPERLAVPADAVALARLDAGANPDSAPFWRYVWIPEATPLAIAEVDTYVNTAVSRAGILVKGAKLGGPGTVVLRYDMRVLAPKEEDLVFVGSLWEKFQEDEPYFLVNGDKVAVEVIKQFIVVSIDEARVMDGAKVVTVVKKGHRLEVLAEVQQDRGVWFKVQVGKETGLIWGGQVTKEQSVEKKRDAKIRVFGQHCGAEAGQLNLLCRSQVPIVRYEYLQKKLLTCLDGGLYYEFRGIAPAPAGSGLTDQDFFLMTFAGVTQDELKKFSVDPRKKIAMFRSRVTGKPRAVVMLSGSGSKVTVNQGIVAITEDMADDDVDPKADPIRNLKQAKFAATEVFVEMPNGMLAYALFDGKGKLQRSAPDNVVKDHSVPEPHTARLQPAISCIRCHVRDFDGKKQEGWLPVRNDVAKLLGKDLDLFGEKPDLGPKFETLLEVSGLYAGNFDKPLSRAKDDLAEAVLRLTGVQDDDTGSSVNKVHRAIATTYNRYVYDEVTPVVACAELGYRVKEDKEAVALLNRLLPPLPVDEFGISPEDPILGALKVGIPISRLQWDQVYGDAVYRAMHTLLKEEKQ